MMEIDASIYRGLVGSLIYLLNTRSDTFHAIILVSRFMNEPSKTSMKQQKGFLGNIQGPKVMASKYLSEEVNDLIGYID